jgi:hypothetical protein
MRDNRDVCKILVGENLKEGTTLQAYAYIIG